MTAIKSEKIKLYAVVAALAAVFCYAAYDFAMRVGIESYQASNFVMDTFVEIKLYGKNTEKCGEEILAKLFELDAKLSAYREGSEISAINQNAGQKPVAVSPEVFAVLKRSKELGEKYAGFDITIGPVTALWAITSPNPQIPEEAQIAEALRLVDYKNLALDDDAQTAMLKTEGQKIDLGAVAKGYACDIIRQICDRHGITAGYVSIGGNLIVLDKAPKTGGSKTELIFGVKNPASAEEAYVATLSLYGQTMSTSGGYERFFESGGKAYCHIFNPQSGYPAESDIVSVSVISPDGAFADALSTVLFIGGAEKLLAGEHDTADAGIIMIDKQNTVWISRNISETVKEFAPSGYDFRTFLEQIDI